MKIKKKKVISSILCLFHFFKDLDGEMLSSKQLVMRNLHLCEDNRISNKERKDDDDVDKLSDKTIKTTKTVLLPLLRKFIYILKKETGFYKFKSLNESGFSLLNDSSHYPTGLESNSVFFSCIF